MKRPAWLLVYAWLAASAWACDELPEPQPQSARPAVSSSAAVTADSADAAADPLAKQYMDAARAHAKTCICSSDVFEGIIRDYCKIIGPEFDALQAAHKQVIAFDATRLSPAAAAFMREAALHGKWLRDYRDYLLTTPIKDRIDKDPRWIRGGVASYQDLARRYNAWHPNAQISGIAYEAYHPGGVTELDRPLWVATTNAEWFTDGANGADKDKKAQYLPWIRCIGGPCLLGY